MMQLQEFNKPDYAGMSEEELTTILLKEIADLRTILQNSTKKTENGFESSNTRPVY